MVLLKILGSVILILIILVIIIASMSILHHLWVLHSMKCKYCGHKMAYKGVGDHNDKTQYMFQCPMCGAWDYMPVATALDDKEASDDKRV